MRSVPGVIGARQQDGSWQRMDYEATPQKLMLTKWIGINEAHAAKFEESRDE